jgi:hypothetical protein
VLLCVALCCSVLLCVALCFLVVYQGVLRELRASRLQGPGSAARASQPPTNVCALHLLLLLLCPAINCLPPCRAFCVSCAPLGCRA